MIAPPGAQRVTPEKEGEEEGGGGEGHLRKRLITL